MIRTWIPKVREKIKVAWAQAVFEDLTDLINRILTHKQTSPIDHPDGSITNEKIADGTIDLTKKCTYIPLNKAGDTMVGVHKVFGILDSSDPRNWIEFWMQPGYSVEARVSRRLALLNMGTGRTLFLTDNIWIDGSIWPRVANYYDLGDSIRPFRNLYLGGHIILPPTRNILARVYDGSPKQVTETSLTLKDEVLPTSPKSVIYPNHVIVSYNNPTGSGVVLGYELKMFHSDETETVAFSRTEIGEGIFGTDDLLEETLADAMKDGCSITRVRLYAFVSASPPAGYEPTVILKLRGVQF